MAAGTAVEGTPAVHTVVAGTDAWGMTAALHTVAEASTAAVGGIPEPEVVVGSQPPGVGDKHAGVGETRTVGGTAFAAELAEVLRVGIRCYTVVAVLKLQMSTQMTVKEQTLSMYTFNRNHFLGCIECMKR